MFVAKLWFWQLLTKLMKNKLEWVYVVVHKIRICLNTKILLWHPVTTSNNSEIFLSCMEENLRSISQNSQKYHSGISGKYHTYIMHNSNVSQSYIISDIRVAYPRPNSDISRASFKHILDILWANILSLS